MLPMMVYYFFLSLCCMLSGCGGPSAPNQTPMDNQDKKKLTFGSVLGDDFLKFGPGKKNQRTAAHAQANPHLWRAAIDTLSFMPLASADAVGGVITTDWYTSPDHPHERLKVSVLIVDKNLRSDAVKVYLYTQRKQGEWVNVPSDSTKAKDLEEIILKRARDLYIHTSP